VTAQNDSSARYVLLDQLAEEIAGRYRRGERPTLHEYLARYPELASELRELFPALVQVEQVKDDQRAMSVPTPQQAPALRQLGDYRILRVIGQGGMGVVYEAEQVSLGRRVALKVLPVRLLSDPKYRSRFEREARAAARLHHTNIVPVFGVGEYDGTPYYAMQFIQGHGLDAVLDEVRRIQLGQPATVYNPASSLAHSLLTGAHAPTESESPPDVTPAPAPNGPLTEELLAGTGTSAHRRRLSYWQSVASIGKQVAEALDYAHKQGVTHRDIKPSNLLLDTHGTVWVTDFGLAKTDDQANLTHTGDILGTLRYMPPEAFDGKSDRRGDIYSLGLTLYELLALRPAFDETDRPRLMRQVTGSQVPRLESLKRGIPIDLATIVHKAIDPDPAHRYQTAGEMAADLQRFLADEPIQARRAGVLERSGRWCRKNPVAAALVTLVGLVLTAAVVVPIMVAHALSVEQGNTQSALIKSRNAEKSALRQAAVSVLERAVGLCDSGEVGRGLVWLSHGLDLSIRAEAPDLEEAFRWNVAAWSERVPSLVASLPVPTIADAVTLSPNDTIVAAACRDGKVRLWYTADGKPAGPTLPHPGRVQAVAFLPGGQTLLTGDEDGTARLWDWKTGKELRRLVHYTPPPGLSPEWPFTRGILCVAVSPDGQLAVTAGRDDCLQFWSLPDGQPVGAPLKIGQAIFSVAFSADSRQILVAHQWSVNRYDVTTRERSGTEINTGGVVHQAVWAPDGTTIATASMQQCSVERYSLSGPRPRPASLPHRGPVTGVGFTPDGRWLASVDGQVIRLWNASTGAPAGPALPHGSSIRSLAMSQNRPLLATGADGAVRLWRLPADWPSQESRQHVTWTRSVLFSADGQRLFIGETSGGAPGGGGRVVPFDLATGQLGPTLLVQQAEGWVQSMALSPDGRTLFTASNKPGRVNRWDVETGRLLGQTPIHGDQVWRLALSPDGKRLATGTFDYEPAPKGCSALLWDARRGVPLGPPLAHGGKVFGLAFSPDGNTLLTGSHDGTTRLWNAATGDPLGPPCRHDAEVWSVAYHPDGKRAVIGLGDGTVRLWDVAQGKSAGPAPVHSGGIHHVQFLARGALVLACSADGTARLWHADTGQPIGPIMNHTRAITSGCVSPDGKRIATAGDDRIVRIWPLVPPLTATVEAIRREVETRTNLTLDEDSTLRVLSPDDWQERAGGGGQPPDARIPAPVSPPRTTDPVPIRINLSGPFEERSATAEQIRMWIAALDTPEPGPALRELLAAGPAALPDLVQAEATAKESVRPLLRQLRERIERSAAVIPRRMTLKLDNTPLDDAVPTLAKESGLPLILGEPSAARVSLDLKDVPVWRMVDELRRQANLGAGWRNNKLVLSPGQALPPELVTYPGPFRLQVASLVRSRGRQFVEVPPPEQVAFEHLQVTLNLAGANPGRILSVGQARLTSATTDSGETVSVFPGGSTQFEPVGSQGTVRSYLLSVSPLKKPASTITLTGVLPILVQTQRREQLEFEGASDKWSQFLPLADGGYIRIRMSGSGLGLERGYVSGSVEMLMPGDAPANARMWLPELVDGTGQTIRGKLELSLSNRRTPMSEDVLWLTAPESVPWAALALQARPPRAYIGSLAFTIHEALGAKARLQLSIVQKETVELPFTFKDVPLP
jgi:WD40 repeat protein/serine/threonine protein kinase